MPDACGKCRTDYQEGGKKPPCYEDEACIRTKRTRTDLNYTEYRLWSELMQFLATGELLLRDHREREILIKLKAKYLELTAPPQEGGKLDGRRRSKDPDRRGR